MNGEPVSQVDTYQVRSSGFMAVQSLWSDGAGGGIPGAQLVMCTGLPSTHLYVELAYANGSITKIY